MNMLDWLVVCEFAEQKTVIIEDIKFVREMAKKEVVIMEQNEQIRYWKI